MMELIDEKQARNEIIWVMRIVASQGLIVLGRTAKQVEDVTAMAVKPARVLLGAYSVDGPRYLSPKDVDRIHTRLDEVYRCQLLGLEKRD